jgi:hypothetical protein
MKNLLILVAFLCSFNAIGQEKTNKNGTPSNQKFGLSISYNAYKIANPGLQIGLEKNIATTSNYQIVRGLHLQFHSQKDKQTAIGLNARLGMRYTTTFGLMLENHVGLGVQQTIYTSQVFDLSTNPIAESSTKTSKLGIKPNIALGFGYDFDKKTNFPVLFYVRPSFNWLYPDLNLVMQTAMNLEMGIVYKIRRG